MRRSPLRRCNRRHDVLNRLGFGRAFRHETESLQDGHETFRVRRLEINVVGAGGPRHAREGVAFLRGVHDDRQVAVLTVGAYPPDRIETLHARQHVVHEDDVGRTGGKLVEAGLRAIRGLDLETLALEQVAEHEAGDL